MESPARAADGVGPVGDLGQLPVRLSPWRTGVAAECVSLLLQAHPGQRCRPYPHPRGGNPEGKLRRADMDFAIKAEIHEPRAATFAFSAQKTMYGGKKITAGDTI